MLSLAGVPSGTILAVHLQKCSHLSNEIRVMQKKLSFSIIKQLMPAHHNCSPLVCCFQNNTPRVNNYDVHLKCSINCILSILDFHWLIMWYRLLF
jgi:hypothetical protein